MMRLARIALTVAMLSSVCLAAYKFVILPHSCNVERNRLRSSTQRVARLSDDFAATLLARRNLDAALTALRGCPHELDLYMVAAGNLRAIGRLDEAAEIYQRALRIDRRPEIYFNLGLVEIKLGRRTEAIEHFTMAAVFDDSWQRDIPLEAQREVLARVSAHRSRVHDSH